MKKKFIILLVLAEVSAVCQIINAQNVSATSGTTNYVTKWTNGSPNYVIGNSLIFDNGTQVGIGTTSPASQLSVGGNGNASYLIFGHNSSGANGAQGIRGEVATPSSGGNKTYATLGVVTCGNGYAYGLYGSSTQATQGSAGRAYGVYGVAGNATCGYNYGVYGKVTAASGGCDGLTGGGTGVYGADCGANDSLIVGCWAGYFSGKISVRSTIAELYGGTAWTQISDKRLKTNITPFADGLSVLRKINPVNYQYNGIGGTPAGQNFIGVIAQDVLPVAPYCIGKSHVAVQPSQIGIFGSDIKGSVQSDSSTRYVAEVLNYNSNDLFYVMLNSIKQLDSTVTTLQNKITTLEGGSQRHNNSGDNNDSGKNIQDIKLALPDAITLGDAQPNPNNGSTQIPYYIPDNTSNAKIIFTDMLGKVMKEQTLQSGYGLMNVDTQDLPSGIYNYSLVVDGKVIDNKKMMRNK